MSANKRWKRTAAISGPTVDKDPPVNTPKWALSDEWKEEMNRRDELAQGEQTEG